MKHVVLFSGGAASAYVAYLVKNDPRVDKRDIVLLHTPTLSEVPDSEKFRLKVARHLELPMTVWGRGEDLWDMIDRNHCLPGNFFPFCTQQFKIQMKEEYFKYLESIGEEYVEYLGFGPNEHYRVAKAEEKASKAGRIVEFPLYRLGITSEECKRIIRDEWNIPLPSSYENLPHNNCIPCFKAGKSYWYAVWKHYPEQYEMAAGKEEEQGHTVFKGITLRELAEKFSARRELEDNQVLLEEFFDLPCSCVTQ